MDNIVLSLVCDHNATVGLSINGEVVCLISEERLNRLKTSWGFPYKALQYIVKTYLDNNFSIVSKIILYKDDTYCNFISKPCREIVRPYRIDRLHFLKHYIFYRFDKFNFF
jgi:predicted NodU family carbamoyl transferase